MRFCGDCTACCTVLEIPQVSPRGETCQHVCEAGCGIYFKRPQICRDWWCQWLADADYTFTERLFDESHRPDKIGIVFDLTARAELVAREVWAGALDEQKPLLEKLAERCVVLAMPFKGPA